MECVHTPALQQSHSGTATALAHKFLDHSNAQVRRIGENYEKFSI